MGALIGKKYGMLKVLNDELYIQYKSGRCKKGLFKCDCGNIKEIRFSSVSTGVTTSCGCKQSRLLSEKNTVHGLSKHPLYKKWLSIKNRCYIKSNIEYKNYGGRSIEICKEWKNNFKNFYDWSILNGYVSSLTIDRINNDGNYEPSNCRYVDLKSQQNNKRNNFYITFNGDKKTLSEWSDISGVNSNTIRGRILNGVDIEHSIFSKENHNKGALHYNYGKVAFNSKKVLNKNTGEIYNSKTEASKKIFRSLWYVENHIKDDSFFLKELP